MSRELRVDDSVNKRLNKIPRHYAQRIREVIYKLVDNPLFGDVKKMKGEKSSWRRRVGPYRIFYEVYPSYIYVYDLDRRTSTTY